MPSSVAVSEVAEAAPALVAGAALTTMSVPRIIIGITPMPMIVMPTTSSIRSSISLTRISAARPTAASTRPPLTSRECGI
tara:strand:+ start:1256 stop:1495 length:240 start_codon:yes stop_codon:yes gene_type:complete